jgi:hypothetical protein
MFLYLIYSGRYQVASALFARANCADYGADNQTVKRVRSFFPSAAISPLSGISLEVNARYGFRVASLARRYSERQAIDSKIKRAIREQNSHSYETTLLTTQPGRTFAITLPRRNAGDVPGGDCWCACANWPFQPDELAGDCRRKRYR